MKRRNLKNLKRTERVNKNVNTQLKQDENDTYKA